MALALGKGAMGIMTEERLCELQALVQRYFDRMDGDGLTNEEQVDLLYPFAAAVDELAHEIRSLWKRYGAGEGSG